MSLRNIWRALIVPVVVSLLGLNVPAANAGEGIPSSPSCVVTLLSGDEAVAPAPSCFDPAGADQDEIMVGADLTVAYAVDGSWVLDRTKPISTNGSSSVVVTTEIWPEGGSSYVGPSWRLDFNIDPVGEVPADTYGVAVGQCFDSGFFRHAKAWVRNGPTPDARRIESVWPDTESVTGAVSVLGIQPMSRIFDGATAETALGDSLFGALPTGYTYVVTFYRSDTGDARTDLNRYVAYQTTVDVPKCGTSGGGTVAVKPRANISVLKCRPRMCRVKVVLGSHQAAKATRYTVIKDPRRGPTVRKTFNVKYKVLYLRNVRKRTLMKVTWPPRKVVSRRVP